MYSIDPSFVLISVLIIFLLVIGIILISDNKTVSGKNNTPVITNITKDNNNKLTIHGKNFSMTKPQIVYGDIKFLKPTGFKFKNRFTVEIPTNIFGTIPLQYYDGVQFSNQYLFKLTDDNPEYTYEINDNILSFKFENIVPDTILLYRYMNTIYEAHESKDNSIDTSKLNSKIYNVLIIKDGNYYFCKDIQII